MGLLLVLLFVIPLYVFHLVFTGLGLSKALSLVPATFSLGLFLWAFWTLGDPFPILAKEHGMFSIEQVKPSVCAQLRVAAVVCRVC